MTDAIAPAAPPDFDQIAQRLVAEVSMSEGQDSDEETARLLPLFTEQLRRVWNARGAADIAKLDTALPATWIKAMDAAVRSLDR